jgi:hypothetical protein
MRTIPENAYIAIGQMPFPAKKQLIFNHLSTSSRQNEENIKTSYETPADKKPALLSHLVAVAGSEPATFCL